ALGRVSAASPSATPEDRARVFDRRSAAASRRAPAPTNKGRKIVSLSRALVKRRKSGCTAAPIPGAIAARRGRKDLRRMSPHKGAAKLAAMHPAILSQTIRCGCPSVAKTRKNGYPGGLKNDP